MSFWKRRNRQLDLERELRRNRPEARPEFLAALEAHVREHDRSRAGFRRLGLALAFTLTLVVGLASVGGIGLAADTLKQTVETAKRIVTPVIVQKPKQGTAAADQYGKVMLCHRGHEIVVDQSAVASHVAHGDTIGPCPNRTSQTIGTDASDQITTGAGNDIVRAGGGDDRVSAGAGNDLLVGGAGRDVLLGGPGSDVLDGRDGRGGDVLDGGPGFDVCLGDQGDRFIGCEIGRRS